MLSLLFVLLFGLVPQSVLGANELYGSGTTNPSKFFWEVMDLFKARARPSVEMSYRAIGSGPGQTEFVGRDNSWETYDQDFGSGDIPISQTDYDDLDSNGKDILHFPFQFGAMSFFHHVPQKALPLAGLKLTGCLLARIFKRNITTWDHADIMAENDGLLVPAGQPIKVYHRVYGSSTTGGITTYLRAACPSEWSANDVGSTITWASGTFEAQGSSVMSASISGNEYSIGYIDAGHGHDDNLDEVSLENLNGIFRTSTEAALVNGVQNGANAALTAGVLPSDPSADFSHVSLHNMAGDDVWPIIAVSYIYLRKDLSSMDGEKACLLKAFLEYVISEKGQALLPRYKFVPISDPVKVVAQAAIGNLTMPSPACTAWTFESKSTTLVGDGQENYVLSEKRRDFAEYDRNGIHSELDAIRDEIAAVEDKRLGTQLHGSGTTNPSKFFWEAMSLFEARAKPSVKMTYRAIGSGPGQTEFVGRANNFETYDQNFGSGDIPISQTDYNDLTSAGQTIMHFPFQFGAMSFFHHIPKNLVPADGLKLNGCLLAKIFKRVVTTWDDAEIVALNQDMNVPAGQPIKVYHRVHGSSTTGGITTYLHAACPAVWTSDLVGSVITWDAGTYGAQGSSVMSASISGNEYSIGYIDAGHGHDDNLEEVSLYNRAGFSRTSAEAALVNGVQNGATAALDANILPADPTADFSTVSFHNMDGDNVWPIIAVSYIYVRQDLTDMGDKACLLKAFLEFVISAKGQAMLPRYKFVPIPAEVKAVSQTAIDGLVMPKCQAWTFESKETTLAGAGQEDYVVSEKRRAFGEYERSGIQSALEEIRNDILLEVTERELHGSGTTNPSKFFWETMDLFEARAKPSVKMSYRAIGSGPGQTEFVGQDNDYEAFDQDFGSGDIPISEANYNALTQAGKTILHFPFQFGAMSFFHHVPTSALKNPAAHLKLDGCLLAKIFKRVITTWDDADIVAMNPGLTVPAGQEIKVYHRVHGSSTTGGITTYLHAACPAVWTANLVGSTIIWEAGTFEAQGSSVMSSSISGNEYSIGYIDAGHGHDDGLDEVSLKNRAGIFRTSTEAADVQGVQNGADAALAANVLPTNPSADFSHVSLHNMDGEDVWPIIAVSYIYVRQDLTAMADKACLLKAFLEFVISDKGQAMLPRYKFVPISAQVKAVSQAAIDALEMPVCKEWSFESKETTLVGAGQRDHVVSEKRRDFAEYDRGINEAELFAKIALLEQQLQTAQGLLSNLDSQTLTTPNSGTDDDDDSSTDPIAVVALIVGLLALLLSVVVFCKMNNLSGSWSGLSQRSSGADSAV